MKVYIGSMKYDLVLKETIKYDEQEYRGAIDECSGKLEMATSFPQQIKQQTLWHEVVHGVLIELGRRDLNSDEGFVDAISKQLYTFTEKNDINKLYSKLND